MKKLIRFAAAAVLALGAFSILPARAGAPPADPRLEVRAIGNPKAPVTVQEWFSLTCTHCAHFALEEFPEIKTKLIDTGKVRYEFHDFPLDQVSLVAAMVARSLPAERYLPFITALFSRQMQWAFSDEDPIGHLQQEAALAGISKAEFDRIRNDEAFARALFDQTQKAIREYQIPGTPYFRFNGVPYAQDPETFAKFRALAFPEPGAGGKN